MDYYEPGSIEADLRRMLGNVEEQLRGLQSKRDELLNALKGFEPEPLTPAFDEPSEPVEVGLIDGDGDFWHRCPDGTYRIQDSNGRIWDGFVGYTADDVLEEVGIRQRVYG